MSTIVKPSPRRQQIDRMPLPPPVVPPENSTIASPQATAGLPLDHVTIEVETGRVLPPKRREGAGRSPTKIKTTFDEGLSWRGFAPTISELRTVCELQILGFGTWRASAPGSDRPAAEKAVCLTAIADLEAAVDAVRRHHMSEQAPRSAPPEEKILTQWLHVLKVVRFVFASWEWLQGLIEELPERWSDLPDGER